MDPENHALIGKHALHSAPVADTVLQNSDYSTVTPHD